jgi:hypothetical protein
MGVPVPVGTGLFKLLHNSKNSVVVKKRTRLMELAESELKKI